MADKEVVYKNLMGYSFRGVVEANGDDTKAMSFLVDGYAYTDDQSRTVEEVGKYGNIPVCAVKDQIFELPQPEQDVFLIVSREVLLMAKLNGRAIRDLLVPDVGGMNCETCVRLLTYDRRGYYCNQSAHCGEQCKYGQKHCFGQN